MTFTGRAPTAAELSGVRYIFTDIDDTLTTGGKLLPQTYQALWDLSDAGIAVVPVTGGSAGWCEHIVRAWPVAAAIAESGAVAMTQQGGRVHLEFWEDERIQRQRQSGHLAAIAGAMQEHGNFTLAADQPFRLADVAIDIAGHDSGDVDALANAIRASGAMAAISSIHINTWVGTYNKRTMSERVLETLSGLSLEDAGNAVCFVGDSRNDAPMFSAVRNSFGVANITPFLPSLPTTPRWISARAAGLGFCDIARAVVSAKS